MSFPKFVKWFLVSAVLVMLTACGGGGSDGDPDISETVNPIIEEFNSVPPAKVTYEVKSDVVEYSATDAIKRADEATTFTAPSSMGLSEGDVFIYENVAYRISMMASDEASDTVKIFTQQPTLDEVVENLEINGSIPFSVPEIDTASSFKLKAKVTDRKTNKIADVTFMCGEPKDELKPKEVENGFTFGVTCTAKSGNATITITSIETIKGGVLVDYVKGRDDSSNKIGFSVSVDVESTITGDYKIEIDNDQDPSKLFGVTVPVLNSGVTVSVDYFFLAGMTFEGGVNFTRTDEYSYKREYNFNRERVGIGSEPKPPSSENNLTANVSVGAHVGIRPMSSIGILGVNLIGLYVDAKIKETINVSGELSRETAESCVTSKLYFTLQAGYKMRWGDYKLLGSEYPKELRSDKTEGCENVYKLDFLDLVCKVPHWSYNTSSNQKIINSDMPPVQYSLADTSSDGLHSELVDEDSYERIIEIDKTGIGDKTISKVTWEVVGGDMGLEITPLENDELQIDGSRIMLSASDEHGNDATLRATIKATDGTTLSQETSVYRNSKPVAVPRVYVSGTDLVLDASSSYDPDGNRIVGYGWFFTDTGKKIINKNPINKVPLSNLSNPVNLKMAVVSDNQPKEASEIESVSFDSAGNGTIAITEAMLSGKTFYFSNEEPEGTDYKSWSFSNGTLTVDTVEWEDLSVRYTETVTYSIEDGKILMEDKPGELMHIILKSQSSSTWEIRVQSTTNASYGRDMIFYLSKPADYPAAL